MTILTLKKRVVFGAYVIYFIRKLKTPVIGESFLFVLLLGGLFSVVSIHHVLTNMVSSGNLCHFLLVAFLKTNFIVQFIVVSISVLSIFFVRNFTLQTSSYLRERFA